MWLYTVPVGDANEQSVCHVSQLLALHGPFYFYCSYFLSLINSTCVSLCVCSLLDISPQNWVGWIHACVWLAAAGKQVVPSNQGACLWWFWRVITKPALTFILVATALFLFDLLQVKVWWADLVYKTVYLFNFLQLKRNNTHTHVYVYVYIYMKFKIFSYWTRAQTSGQVRWRRS